MPRALITALVVLLLALSPGRSATLGPVAVWQPDSVPDAYSRPSAALMWPGATRAFMVGADGGLFNGVWRVNVVAGAKGRRAGLPRRIASEERWRPVIHWVERAGDVRWEFEAVALPAPDAPLASLARAIEAQQAVRADHAAHEQRRRALTPDDRDRMDRLVLNTSHRLALGAREDVPLVVSVLAIAHNDGGRAAEATLAVSFAPARGDEPFHEPGAAVLPPSWGWCTRAGQDSAIGWCEGSCGRLALRRDAWLEPGGTHAVRFVVASHPLPAARLAAWARTPHEARADEARRWWTRETSRGARFKLNDPEVETAVRAARVVLLACRERRGGHWVPLGSPLQYRDVWLRDGARAIAALATQGYAAEARELAASLLEWQSPHGQFSSQSAQLDGTGQALWAFEQAMLRPAPARELDLFAQSALDAWAWCERTRRVAAGRPGTVAPGMLPVANPQDNELVRGQLIGSDAWALVGYRAAARLLRACGRIAEAEQVEQSRLAYRTDFARAIAHSGSRDVPPSFAGAGRDWGNLTVAYPCDALPAATPRLAALADRYWAQAGAPGLGFWGSPDSLHGYVAADLGTWALRTGRRAEADAVLDALLAWRTASGGAGELFTRTGDYGANLPPHATSAAALLQLVRNSLIDDDGERLALTQGARAHWWRGASVEDAPTRWGLLTLRFELDGNEARWRWTPVPVWTELVLPPGTRLASTPPLPLLPGGRPDVVLAPPGTDEARVTAIKS
jgi:hypothetical protein